MGKTEILLLSTLPVSEPGCLLASTYITMWPFHWANLSVEKLSIPGKIKPWNWIWSSAHWPMPEASLWNQKAEHYSKDGMSWAGPQQPFSSFLFLVEESDLPVRGREILLLLELLLQAHQLELSEDGPTPAWLLQPRGGLLCLRLAAAMGLAGWCLGAGSAWWGLGWQHARAGGSRDEVRDHRGLPGDDRDERVCPQRRGAWQGRKQRRIKASSVAVW